MHDGYECGRFDAECESARAHRNGHASRKAANGSESSESERACPSSCSALTTGCDERSAHASPSTTTTCLSHQDLGGAVESEPTACEPRITCLRIESRRTSKIVGGPPDGQPPERCACMRLKSSPQSMRMGVSEVAAAAADMARWWRARPWRDGSSDMVCGCGVESVAVRNSSLAARNMRCRAQFFAGAHYLSLPIAAVRVAESASCDRQERAHPHRF